MDLDEAYERVRRFLDDTVESGTETEVAVTKAELCDAGWLFHYNSVAFLRSKSFADLLGGNLPILVSADDVRVVPLDELDTVKGHSPRSHSS